MAEQEQDLKQFLAEFFQGDEDSFSEKTYVGHPKSMDGTREELLSEFTLELSEGTLLNNRYLILGKLGAGGMADVYKAKDTVNDSLVAMKRMLPTGERDVKRFSREYQLLKDVDHPNLLKAYDFFEEQGLYMVLEYARGKSLAELLEEDDPLPMAELFSVAGKIACALQVLHEVDILHRDIKPNNIMVHAESGDVKLLDLGIGKKIRDAMSALTVQGHVLGTVAYLSPEQIEGETSIKSDIFSLATTLYQLFVWQKKSPFAAGTSFATLARINDYHPPSIYDVIIKDNEKKPEKQEREIYRKISKLISRGMEKKPEKRLGNCGVIVAECEKLQKEWLETCYDVRHPSLIAGAQTLDINMLNHLHSWKKEAKGENLGKTTTIFQRLVDNPEQKRSIRDAVFQRLVTALNLVNPEQMKECIRHHIDIKKNGKNSPFALIAMRRHLLPAEIIQRIALLQDDQGNSLIPEYEVLQEIGEGGMAAVYLGKNVATGELKAVKIFLPQGDASIEVARFQQEFEVSKELTHPNIIKATVSGEFYGMYYMVMDYVAGDSLLERIQIKGTIAEKQSLELFESIMMAMIYAWQKGFVHRDIKPANIMLGKDGLKICDFGLAKVLDSNMQLTKTGTVMGTPQYMSPEQFESAEVDYRGDVYSLGVSLYLMLSGVLPFTGDSYVALCKAHLYNAPRPLPAHISKGTRLFVYKLLAKKPEDRCLSSKELWRNLQRAKKNKKPRGKIPFQKSYTKWVIACFLIIVCIAAVFLLRKNLIPKKNNIEQKQVKQTEKVDRPLPAENIDTSKLQEEKAEQEERERIKKEQIEQEKREKIRKEKEEKEKQKKQGAVEFALAMIDKHIEKLEIQKAGAELNILAVRFPDEPKIIKLKKFQQQLMNFEQQLANLKHASQYQELSKIVAEMQNDKIICRILQKKIEELTDQQVEKILLFYLHLVRKKTNFPNIVQDISWPKLEHLCMTLPREETKLLCKLAFQNPDYREKVHSVQNFRQTLLLLRHAGRMSHCPKLLQKPNVALKKAMALLTVSQKKQMIKKLPGWKKLDPNNFRVIFDVLLQEQKNIRFLVAGCLGRYRTTSADRLLVLMARREKDLSVMQIIVQSLAKRKLYGELFALFQKRGLIVREQVIKILAGDRTSQARKILVRALSDGEPIIRARALDELAQYAGSHDVVLFAPLLADENMEVAGKAVIALSKIKTAKSLNAMIEYLRRVENLTIGRSLIKHIAYIKTEKSQQALLYVLREKPLLKEDATQALIKNGRESITPLLEALKKAPDGYYQRTLVKILQEIGAPAAPGLCTLLKKHPSRSLPKILVETLGEIGDPIAIDILGEKFIDNRTKRQAESSLRKIQRKLKPTDHRYKKIDIIIKNY